MTKAAKRQWRRITRASSAWEVSYDGQVRVRRSNRWRPVEVELRAGEPCALVRIHQGGRGKQWVRVAELLAEAWAGPPVSKRAIAMALHPTRPTAGSVWWTEPAASRRSMLRSERLPPTLAALRDRLR